VFEVEDAVELLNCLHLRDRIGAELIACPSCGRIQVDLFSLVDDVRKQLADEIDLPIKVAVMGCVVNGPGEAEGADVAVFAGDRRGIIYVQGERGANVHEDEILQRLLEECRHLQDRVQKGETKLGDKVVTITPPTGLTVEGHTN
jgi:(E)-4-hydroxy-3-methylbut-2-enyl-diphosphate synthase